MKRLIKKGMMLLVFIVFLILFVFVQNPSKVFAVSYQNVNLNDLSEIEDNQELLDTVSSVTISFESDLQLVNILSKCHNLKKLSIMKATIDDLTFINNIEPVSGFELYISMGYYNMMGLENSYIKRITIDSAFITNFSDGMNLQNVEYITINYVSGYEDIDYSNYHNLKSLYFYCISISNYKTFFEQLKSLENLKSLGLIASNITDSDTKYLKELNNITSLNLESSSISDISFLEDMQQLTFIRPPISVNNMDVIKKMPNLKSIYWNGYEQLSLTDDLVQYLDDNNISHSKYDSNLKNTLLNMVNEMNIDDNMSIKEKVERVIDYTSNYVVSHDTFYDSTYTGNSLLYIVNFKIGVCSNYSDLEYALLKLIGIDTYYIGGLIPVYMSELSGDFYVDELKYELAGHAWLMVQDENGLWYGWDPVQIDQGTGTYENDREIWNTVSGKNYNFWKNPYEDDLYTLNDYYDGKYDTFNYYFAKRRNVTNKIGYNDYLNEVKIIFNSNNDENINSKQRVYKNENFKLNKNLFEKYGYTFDMWNTKPDGSGSFYEDEEIVNIDDNITLYAQWKKNTYTIQFDSNGADGIMQDETDIVGEYRVPECEFTNSNQNMEFVGWLIESTGSVLYPGMIIWVDKDTKLIAQWEEKKTYVVSFNTDEGSPVADQIIEHGGNATIPYAPTREGYKFVGWYEDSTYNFLFDFGRRITSNITIYAKWAPNERVIKTMNIEVPLPTVGDEVTIEKYGEYYLWETQKPQLNIKILGESHYKLLEEGPYMFWYKDFEHEWIPFVGTFEYDNDYYIRLFFVTESEYYFDDNIEILVNGKYVDKIFYLGDQTLQIGVILTTPKDGELIEYKILEGANQTYSIHNSKNLKIRANGELSKFVELKVDNVTLDSSNYYVSSGSTVVVLKDLYLNTLTEGEHSLTFVYTDGEVTTNFIIDKSTSNSNNDISEKSSIVLLPKTGDNIKKWFFLLVISFSVINILIKLRKKNKIKG